MRLLTVFSSIAICWLLIASTALAGEITVQLPVWEVDTVRDDGTAAFTGKNIQYLALPGEPALPYHSVKLALPEDADLASVEAKLSQAEYREIDGLDVPPMPPVSISDRHEPFWPSKKNVVDGRDMNIYLSDSPFPRDYIHKVNVGHMRRQPIIEVLIAPFQYHPVTKKLRRISSAVLTVSYRERSPAMRGMSFGTGRNDPVLDKHLKGKVLNFSGPDLQQPKLQGGEAEKSESFGALTMDTQEDQSEPQELNYGYAIITTQSIASASSELAHFIESKQLRGFEVYLITEDDWGGGTGDTAADNIRNWLAANYLTYDLEYVLLIGNPNPSNGDVPMKKLWPRKDQTYEPDHEESPSDYYYADLTGNWDLDGDNFYGEWGDDFGIGGVDRFWEVLVGRIPYYGSISDLDAILAKLIAYEQETTPEAGWRGNVLLPMEPSDGSTPGYHLGDAIKNDFLVPKAWAYHRVYDLEDSQDQAEQRPCEKYIVRDAWNDQDFGLVIWWTHGSSTSASGVMDNSHAAYLNNEHPSFTFQTSCHNGQPESSVNLAYTLLKNGAVNTVAASRVSWYYPGDHNFEDQACNPGIAHGYAKRLISFEQSSAQALLNVKLDIYPGIDALWMNYTDYNVYGDPEHGLVTAMADTDADGLSDILEDAGCTNPLDADSDDDGLSDGQEDADHDGIIDPGETDPCQADTDGDGVQDGTESGIVDPVADPDGAGPLLGTNTLNFIPDADPTGTTDPTKADTDGDGLTDGEEDINANGAVDPGESDPNSPVSPGEEPAQVPAMSPIGIALVGLLLICFDRRRKRDA